MGIQASREHEVLSFSFFLLTRRKNAKFVLLKRTEQRVMNAAQWFLAAASSESET